MNKVWVIGVSCSGKSTVARKIAEELQALMFDLDDLFWNPHWVETPVDEFREKVKKVVQLDRWVIAGNYQTVADLIQNEADTIIWLDPSLMTVWTRAIVRTFKRVIYKTPICNGNVETLFSKNSILLWIYQDYFRKQRKYSRLKAERPIIHFQF